MANHFYKLYNELSNRLRFYMYIHVNRNLWEENGHIIPEDIGDLYSIIDDTFDEIAPDVQYMVKVALRCTLVGRTCPDTYNNPYAFEDLFDLALRNMQHVLVDYKESIQASLYVSFHSALVIQKQWKRCVSDPHYQVCKNRLRKEFEEVSSELKSVH